MDEDLKRAINDFFSFEEKEFYQKENGIDLYLMIHEFNTFNNDGLIIFTKNEKRILEEWVKENGWDLK